MSATQAIGTAMRSSRRLRFPRRNSVLPMSTISSILVNIVSALNGKILE